MKGPIAWMAGNSVAANLIMAVLLIGGLLIGRTIKQEVFPEFTMDTVEVSVEYLGASPEEVEEGVVLAVEEAVQGIEGIDEIQSVASEGMGWVFVEAVEGADVNRLWQEIESEVDRVDTFPQEAEDPEVRIGSHRRDVITLALHGTDNEQVLRKYAEDIKDTLLAAPGITQVELQGARDYEIHIEMSQPLLRRYSLTLQGVARKIADASVDLGGGSLKTRSGDILLRVKDRRHTAEQYAKIPLISLADGGQILLEDVAEIREAFEESERWATFNGTPAILIQVYRVGDQTPTQVVNEALASVDQVNSSLPGDLQLSVVRNKAEIFQQRANLLLKNAYIGIALVFCCLALFLEARLAFWVSLGIPISFLGSFLLLSLTSFSLNMITMFAFIVTLGIVVDDAIVVGENIYYHRREGKDMFEAAIQGAREVAMPVVFSVLTNIIAFMPLFFVPGMMGKVFKSIPLVVIAVFSVSLIESLFILPAHLSHVRAKRRAGFLSILSKWQAEFSSLVERFVSHWFGSFLSKALTQRYTVLAIGIALLMITLGYVQTRMGIILFPRVESDFAYVEAVLTPGASRQDLKRVETRLTQVAETIVSQHGGDKLSTGIFSRVNGDTVSVRVFLTPPKVRTLSTAALTRKWRHQLGPLSGLESLHFASDKGGPGSGKDLTVQLSHRDTDVLEKAGFDLSEQLAAFSGVQDIDDGSARGKDQFDVHLLPAGERIGLTSREIANQVRHAFHGAVAKRQQRGQNELTVRIWLPGEIRENLASLEDLVLRTSDGQEILLRDAARLVPGEAYTSIKRENGQRVADVTANIIPRSKTDTIIAALSAEVIPELQKKYSGLTYRFAGHKESIKESVSSLLSGLLLAFLSLYAFLAVPFRSYTQPLIIMICIPFGMIGAVIGHLIMGYSLSLMSLFGIVALSGVVINDSLILIDFANRWRRQGETPFRAIQLAGIQRFRPIVLTTLTTFGGLAPMIFETSRQARFLVPMALSLGFGLVFGTMIILIMVPSVYLIVEDVHSLSARVRKTVGLTD
jgi:multidrug efflux pump subunit AcrB